MKKIMIALLFPILMLSGNLIMAKEGAPKPFLKFENTKFLEKHLDLSKKQIASIESINETYRNRYLDIAALLDPMRDSIQEEMKVKEPDFKKIRRIMEGMSPYKIDMHITHLKHKTEVRSVLSLDQQQKFDELLSKKRKHYSKHMKRHKKRKNEG